MNKPLTKLIFVVLMLAIGGMTGCKKVEAVYEADVLGTWEIKSWTSNSSDIRFAGCDMLGTLTFAKVDWGGVRVDFTFKRDGSVRTLWGYANLEDLPVIRFECMFGEGFSDNLAFRGLIEDDGMIGYGGFFWDMESYNNWEWEAVKK